MHTLKVTLKQHTPLIHFQHDQEGATLRASEVKPKLDKFILTKLGEKPTDEQKNKGQEKWEEYKTNFNKNKEEKDKEKRDFDDLDSYEKGTFIAKALDWLVGKGEHPALDYKMRIEAEGGCFKKQLKIINAKREAVIYEKNLLKINTGEYMAKLLMEYISPFFVVHNFGYRQSKGYGSYTVTDFLLDGKQVDVPTIEINNVLCSNYFNTICLLSNVGEHECFRKFEFNPKSYCKIPKGKKVKLYPLQYEFQNEETPSPFNEMDSSTENKIKEIIGKCIRKIVRRDSNLAEELIEQISKTNFSSLKEDYQYNYFSVLFSKFIDQNYQKYKQGTREDKRNNVRYDKAGIWHYFNRLEKTGNVVYWEKRAIKQKISSLSGCLLHGYSLKNGHKEQIYNELNRPDNESQQYHYIRAILGLAETFEFQTNDKNVKFEVKINGIDEETEKAERAQSAIIFKIIEDNVYVCLRKPNEVLKILNKNFSLSMNIVKKASGTKQKLNDQPIELRTISTQFPPKFKIEDLYNDIINLYEKEGYQIIKL